MKEATGELNMTVITVVAIAAVAAFFYAFVWPAIKTSINRGTYCANSWGCKCEEDVSKMCTCQYCADKGGGDASSCSEVKSVQCPNPNKAS